MTRRNKKDERTANAGAASSEYRGKCPVCSGQLDMSSELKIPADAIVPKDARMLYCTVHPEHFVMWQEVFEQAWDKYDRGAIPGDTLLAVLLDNNLTSAKPAMSRKWSVAQ
jgi:hypothetical protein